MQPGIVGYCDPWSARPGETITLSADPGLVHLFDAETGMRCNA